MLPELHASLRALLFQEGGIPDAEVDIRFEAPTREEAAAYVRPTLSLFLYEIRENNDLRYAAPQSVRGATFAERRMPPRRFDLHYYATAVAGTVEDEHSLLWRCLTTLLRCPDFPPELLPASMREADLGVGCRVANPDPSPDPADFWQAMQRGPRLGFLFSLTVAVDPEFLVRSPLVLSRELRLTRDGLSGGSTIIGGRVLDGKGSAVAGANVTVAGRPRDGAPTDADGRYTLAGLRPGEYNLVISLPDGSVREYRIRVPSDSYDLAID